VGGTSESFVEETVAALKKKLGNDKVVLGLSGGVDSSVAAKLLDKAIGDNLHCIFVDLIMAYCEKTNLKRC